MNETAVNPWCDSCDSYLDLVGACAGIPEGAGPNKPGCFEPVECRSGNFDPETGDSLHETIAG